MISIIIPCYNIAPYIERCVNSILNQSFIDFEIILVNDGSTDGTKWLIDDLESKDQRIQVIHKENEGVTLARYAGVNIAKGDYIMFVDGDDSLVNDSLGWLYEYAISSDLDIVCGAVNRIVGGVCNRMMSYSNTFLCQTDYLNKFLCQKLHWGPWGRLFKRELFILNHRIVPSYIKRGEDAIMNVYLAFVANRFGTINMPVYNYCLRKDSISMTKKQDWNHSFEFDRLMVEPFVEEGVFKIYASSILTFRAKWFINYLLLGGFYPINTDWLRNFYFYFNENKNELEISRKESRLLSKFESQYYAKIYCLIFRTWIKLNALVRSIFRISTQE